MWVLNYFVFRGHAALSTAENNKLHGTNNYLHFPPFTVFDCFPFCFFAGRVSLQTTLATSFPLFNGVLNTVWVEALEKDKFPI